MMKLNWHKIIVHLAIFLLISITGLLIISNIDELSNEYEQSHLNAEQERIAQEILHSESIPEIPERQYIYFDIPLDRDTQEYMQDVCAEQGVDYKLMLAVMKTESDFNASTVSRTKDYGLMQINKVNFKWLDDEGIDPLTVEGNIKAGALILSQKLKSYGEIELALMAYNCGDVGAKRLWDAGTYSTRYTHKVMKQYHKRLAILEDE